MKLGKLPASARSEASRKRKSSAPAAPTRATNRRRLILFFDLPSDLQAVSSPNGNLVGIDVPRGRKARILDRQPDADRSALV